MVTKQHFIQTAQIIKRARENAAGQYDDPKAAMSDPEVNKFFSDIATFFADAYENDNDRFNREMFLKACGFDGKEKEKNG